MTPIEARPRGGWQQQLRVPSSAVTSPMPLTSHGAPSHSVPIHLPASVLLSTQIELPLDADSNDLVFTGPGGGNGVPFGHERSCHATAFAGSIRTQPIAPEAPL